MPLQTTIDVGIQQAADAALAAGVTYLVGRLFGVGRDFDQDRAKVRLTDANLHILREANPAEDTWAYLATLGAEREERWSRYLAELQEKGLSRDRPGQS